MFQNCCNMFKVYPHIAWTIQKGQTPTAQGLKEHFSSISSMKMQVLFEAVTRYLLAIVLFRNGLRRNNWLAMQSARRIFCPSCLLENTTYIDK